jgi:hypothetical protein
MRNAFRTVIGTAHGDNTTTLGEPIGRHHQLEAQFLAHLANQFNRHRRSTGHGQAQATQVILIPARMRQQ